MTISNLFNIGLTRKVVIGALCAIGISVQAQTFINGGVIYSISNGKAVTQSTKDRTGKPKVCENGTAPDVYTGNIVIPTSVTYNGITYPVEPNIGSAFKGSDITSISIPDNAGFTLGDENTCAFQNCTKLTTVKLNNDLLKIYASTFDGCTSLKALTIPGSVCSIYGSAFDKCNALETLVFEDGEEPLYVTRNVFGSITPVVKNLTINRKLSEQYEYKTWERPFHNADSLERLVIGGSCTSIPASFFRACPKLSSITFNSDITYIGEYAFADSYSLEEVTLPNSLTHISQHLFSGSGALKKVTLGNAVTHIDKNAFMYTSLKDGITLPNTLTTIGEEAFAFASNLTSITIPASVTSIGEGAFINDPLLAKYEVAAGNETYASAADGSYIATKDGETLVAYAPAFPATSFKGNFKAVAPYAFYRAEKLTSIELPNCTEWGDWSLSGSGIKTLTLSGKIGEYVALGCKSLEILTINSTEVPSHTAFGCSALKTVNLPENLMVLHHSAFTACLSLKSLNLGHSLAMVESSCFYHSGIETLTVAAQSPARMGDDIFDSDRIITVKVPAKLVDTYKASPGWSALNIVGDVNIAEGGQAGMPDGLYYAGDDNQLHCVYADGGTSTYTIDKPHTFQLVSYKNRIYGASAGEQYVYINDEKQNLGDGSLFYVSAVDNTHYQATVLDNTGGYAFKDPFGVYLYGDTLYVSDRNVCMRKISAEALNQPQDYPSWFETDWLPFYTKGMMYGCIKSDFAITTEYAEDGTTSLRYWLGIKSNGRGLFSFTDANIGTADKKVGSSEGAYTYLQSPGVIPTAFTIDSKHNHLYIYIAKTYNHYKAGLYRIDLDDLKPNMLNELELKIKLIDGSPVSPGNDIVGESIFIKQLAIDGDYLYWCYRAPTSEELANSNEFLYPYEWAEAYDESNPLHHTGIKRVKLGEENPIVEMVVPGASGYGIAPVNYINSKTPDGMLSPMVEQPVEAVTIANGTIYAATDATIVIYTTTGMMVNMTSVSTGDTVATDDLAAGIYLVKVYTTAGNQTIKFVK